MFEEFVHNSRVLYPSRTLVVNLYGATSSNIVGIVLADVGFRMFKRSRHVVPCCFYSNTEGSLGLIFTPNSAKLQCCHICPSL